MKCFHCDKEIDRDNQELIIIAIDRPVYVNLTFHRGDCIAYVDGYGRDKYLNDNKEKVYKMAERSPTSADKKTKRK